jgi:hypothetical protein
MAEMGRGPEGAANNGGHDGNNGNGNGHMIAIATPIVLGGEHLEPVVGSNGYSRVALAEPINDPFDHENDEAPLPKPVYEAPPNEGEIEYHEGEVDDYHLHQIEGVAPAAIAYPILSPSPSLLPTVSAIPIVPVGVSHVSSSSVPLSSSMGETIGEVGDSIGEHKYLSIGQQPPLPYIHVNDGEQTVALLPSLPHKMMIPVGEEVQSSLNVDSVISSMPAAIPSVSAVAVITSTTSSTSINAIGGGAIADILHLSSQDNHLDETRPLNDPTLSSQRNTEVHVGVDMTRSCHNDRKRSTWIDSISSHEIGDTTAPSNDTITDNISVGEHKNEHRPAVEEVVASNESELIDLSALDALPSPPSTLFSASLPITPLIDNHLLDTTSSQPPTRNDYSNSIHADSGVDASLLQLILPLSTEPVTITDSSDHHTNEMKTTLMTTSVPLSDLLDLPSPPTVTAPVVVPPSSSSSSSSSLSSSISVIV